VFASGIYTAAMRGEDSDCRGCPICGTAPRKNGLIGHLGATFTGNLRIQQYRLTYCTCDGLIYLDPLPLDEDLNTLYVKTEQFTSPVYTDPARVDAITKYMLSSLTRMLSARTAALRSPVSILEIGAGRAWMCRAAKRLDEASKTVAQDVSTEVANECPWVDRYLLCDLSDQQLNNFGLFHVISLTHVIEHLKDPVSAVQRCRSLLANEGTIFITAPHRPEGWQIGISGISQWQKYSYNHVPAHIQYFSRQSMQKLAERCGCQLSYWDDRHENGQAFEAWLTAIR